MPQPPKVDTTDLMKPEQLAAEWQVAPKTLANLRSRREGPPYLRVLGAIRYSRQAVTDWLTQQQAAEPNRGRYVSLPSTDTQWSTGGSG